MGFPSLLYVFLQLRWNTGNPSRVHAHFRLSGTNFMSNAGWRLFGDACAGLRFYPSPRSREQRD
ncbi:hypothetical protein MAMT_01379 [Methylacidimicrobium tartarophylax]|uniref:Uncharacterized protein n=1 Tax=Methylacidimicrobium tartarophylax TaxID=1041768 RepID=A0A5E6MEN3_9BACT|nr:hypothetical protein MAMT_01379 [Methylacidimicrobium tartarophylax]